MADSACVFVRVRGLRETHKSPVQRAWLLMLVLSLCESIAHENRPSEQYKASLIY